MNRFKKSIFVLLNQFIQMIRVNEPIQKSIFVLLNQFIQRIRVNEPIQKKYICSIESVHSEDSCK